MTQATDDVYYLYVGNGWSGPFRLEQIRVFVKEKQIAPDTFAFEPQQQMQMTVAQLLADPADAATGSYQSPTAPKGAAASGGGAGKSTRLDAYDAKQTVVSARSPQQTAKTGSSQRAKSVQDDDVIDLDAISTAQTGKSRKQDDDVIDLDAVATSATANKSAKKQDDDVIDLDAPRKGDLTVEIDEPAGRAAESTVRGKPFSPQPGSQEALDVVLGELENLRRAYNALMENSIKDREEGQNKVHVAHLAINEVLEERKADIAEIRSLVAEIDQVASELAKKHRDQTLSTRIIRLRDSLQESDVSQMVQFSEAVLRRIVEQFDRTMAAKSGGHPKLDDPFSAFDAAEATPDLAKAQSQLAELRRSYDQLHEQFKKEQEAARERLLSATAMLEQERQTRHQDSAEVRALAGEIYRLACEIDPQWLPRETYERVQALYEELSKETPDAVAMTPVANDVLVGLVAKLRERAEQPSEGDGSAEVANLRKQVKELGSIRAELLQTRTDLGVMRQREQALQEEKARLQQLLDEQKLISEKAQQAAKAREQRLRSTVCALEVTKELHQEVMRDLQSQLASAQGKVEEMEQELRTVRGELTSRRERRKGDDLNGEMRRVVEMRAMLDARKQELAADLRSTEAELQRVSSSEGEDQSLAEMLAAKVNHLRQTYEQTLKRLDDQESKAQALQAELEASRREAGELRGRSDGLNNELENARSNLSAAKKRVEELHLAYQRLESERESLQQELTEARSTTTLIRAVKPEQAPQSDADALAATTLRAETLQAELAREQRRAQDLAGAQESLQARIAELTADRDQLRADLDKLGEEHRSDQERHAAAVAAATQAAIEAESTRKESEARIAELEQAGAGGAASALAPAERQRLEAELAEAKQQAKSALNLLNEARASASAAQTTAAKGTERVQRAAELERRLAEAEKDVEAAGAQRDQVQAQLAAAKAESDRLRREIESAANEHRASLTSARSRLAQEQERTESLERELAELRTQAQATAEKRESINVALAQAVSAKDRLASEVERLGGELAARGATNDENVAKLEDTRAELARAQERIRELEARVKELEGTAAQARTRLPELEAKLARAMAERQQLLSELDRLRGELVTSAQERAEEHRLAADAVEARRLLAESDAERDKLRQQVVAANAELDQLRAELRNINARELERTDALMKAEGQLAVESTRWQTADKLLADARSQFHAVSDERDRAKLELAQAEAQRKTLQTQLERMRAELERIRSNSQGTEADMLSTQDQARIEALEHELIDSRRLLTDMELRETQRLALVTEERDRLAREVEEMRRLFEQPARGGMPDQRSRELERQLIDERTQRESAAREAALARKQVESITVEHRRLESELAALRALPGSAELEKTVRSLKRARKRLRLLEAERDSALTRSLGAPKEPSQLLDQSGDVGVDALVGQLRTLTAGSAPSALRTAEQPRPNGPETAQTEPAFASTFRYPSGSAWTARTPAVPSTMLVARPPHHPLSRYRRIAAWSGAGVVILAGCWAICAWSKSLPASSFAVVNADIMTVKSPVDGTAVASEHRVGDAVERGDDLLVVRKPKPDGSKLASLQRRSEELEQLRTSTETQLKSFEQSLDELVKKRDEERTRCLDEAKAKVADEERALHEAEESAKAKASALATIEPLLAHAKIDAADWESIRRESATAAKAATAAQDALTSAQRRLADVMANRLLGDPQIDDTRASVESQRARLIGLKDEIASNQHAISEEQERIAAPTDFPAIASASGVIWKRRTMIGQTVRAGETVCELADPGTIVVDAVFHDRTRDAVHAGDAVMIAVGSGLNLTGSVLGDGSRHDDHAKVKAVKDSPNSFRVSIAITAPGDRSKLLGESAEVVLLGSEPGAVSRFLGWLHFKLH